MTVTLLKAKWIVGHDEDRHCLYENGEIAVSGDSVLFVGKRFPGQADRTLDYGEALIGPGFVDLDALSDLDTTILAFDNQPAWKKGRVWPRTYLEAGPARDVLAGRARLPEALRLRRAPAQRHHDRAAHRLAVLPRVGRDLRRVRGRRGRGGGARPARLSRPGLPDRQPGRGRRHGRGRSFWFDEERGLRSLDEALRFCRDFEGRAGGLVRTMLAPDRIETCTPELLRRTAAAARDLDVPVRQHSCQSRIEYDGVLKLRGMSPPEWMASLGYLSERTLLPHGTFVSRIEPRRAPGPRSGDHPRRGRDASCIARSCRAASATSSRASRATGRWASTSGSAPTRPRPTWCSTCRSG